MKVVVIMLFTLSALGVLYLVFIGRSTESLGVGGDVVPVEVAESAGELVVSQWAMVNRPNATIGQLMDLYEEWSGREVVGDPELLKKKSHFVMRGPFTNSEGASFLEMTLKLNGYEISKIEGQFTITEVPFQLTEEQKVEAIMKPNLKNERSEEPRYAEGELMSYPSITGLGAAQLLEDSSGKRVIMSTVTSVADFSFTVKGPADHGKIAAGIWKSLNEAGYGFIEVPEHENVLWLVVANEGKVAEARKKNGLKRRTRYVPRPGVRTRYVPRPKE